MTIETRFVFDEEEKEILEKAAEILYSTSAFMEDKDYLALLTYNGNKWGRKFIDDATILLNHLAEIDEPPILLE